MALQSLVQDRVMAMAVGCPCGQNFDVVELDLFVTLPCPNCGRELQLELEDGVAGRRRGVLIIREGPHGVGEHFIMPVGVPLIIGRGPGVWLPLDDEGLEPSHCSIILKQDSSIIVEDQATREGTWAGQQRLVRAKIPSGQRIRVGPFQLEVALKPVEPPAARAQTVILEGPEDDGLPALSRVRPTGLTRQLITYRFPIARWILNISAWILAVYHFLTVLFDHTPAWPRWQASLLAVMILAVLLPCGRRVTLAHRYLRFSPLAVLVVLAIFDLVITRPGAAVAELLLAAGVSLLVMPFVTNALVILAALAGAISLGIQTGALFRVISALAG